MDLGAYANIEDLDKIAKANGIECPRLRGYRLMKDEEPIDLNEWIDGIDVECAKDLCTSLPFWNPYATCHEWSSYTDYLKDFFVPDGKILWNRIHGKKRKILKTYIHNEINKYKKQAEVFNKYVGREDVLYIHARIGGNNWASYKDQVLGKPWFIEKIDDAFDRTYCDIYARVDLTKGE